MNNNGILMVAFGEQYDNFAAHCAVYSRKITNIPFCIISNLEKKHPLWQSVENCQFITLNLPQDENRAVKTSMIKYTPFEKTLYLDCDAIIQRPGIEKTFDLIPDDGIMLNIYGRWCEKSKIPAGYRKAFILSGAAFPINIYYGALCGFTKSDKAIDFFTLWHAYWQQNGRGREMPALACAAKNSGITIRELSNKDKIFTWLRRPDAVVQHEFGHHIARLVGCPEFRAYKPFDHRGRK